MWAPHTELVSPFNVSSGLGEFTAVPYRSETEIQDRVGKMGCELAARCAGYGEVIIIAVLGGASHFAPELSTAVERADEELNVVNDWIKVQSFSGPAASGVVRPQAGPFETLTGRHVVIADGAAETGLTLSWIVPSIRSQGPASLEVAIAFQTVGTEQLAELIGDVAIHAGFVEVGDRQIMGYGNDFHGQGRNLRNAFIIEPGTGNDIH